MNNALDSAFRPAASLSNHTVVSYRDVEHDNLHCTCGNQECISHSHTGFRKFILTKAAQDAFTIVECLSCHSKPHKLLTLPPSA